MTAILLSRSTLLSLLIAMLINFSSQYPAKVIIKSFTTASDEANVAVRALQFAADEINAGHEVPFRLSYDHYDVDPGSSESWNVVNTEICLESHLHIPRIMPYYFEKGWNLASHDVISTNFLAMDQSAKAEQGMEFASAFALSTNRNAYGLSRQLPIKNLTDEQNFRRSGWLVGRRQGVDASKNRNFIACGIRLPSK